MTMSIYYITGNKGKIKVAEKFLKPHGLGIKQKELELIEIQSDSLETITIHKANQAFNKLKHPLLVNDAGWNIPALNGFPGPYMRYVNEWFTRENFLNLMRNKTDRRIIFTEYFCFKDENETKIFSQEAKGTILTEPMGNNISSSWSLVSLRSDGISIAKAWEEKLDPVSEYSVWNKIAEWYKQRALSSKL